jgi:hypothetical protein
VEARRWRSSKAQQRTLASWYQLDAARANAANAAAAAAKAAAQQQDDDDDAPPSPPPPQREAPADALADAVASAQPGAAGGVLNANKPADAALVGALALLFNAAVFSLFAIIK